MTALQWVWKWLDWKRFSCCSPLHHDCDMRALLSCCCCLSDHSPTITPLGNPKGKKKKVYIFLWSDCKITLETWCRNILWDMRDAAPFMHLYLCMSAATNCRQKEMCLILIIYLEHQRGDSGMYRHQANKRWIFGGVICMLCSHMKLSVDHVSYMMILC